MLDKESQACGKGRHQCTRLIGRSHIYQQTTEDGGQGCSKPTKTVVFSVRSQSSNFTDLLVFSHFTLFPRGVNLHPKLVSDDAFPPSPHFHLSLIVCPSSAFRCESTKLTSSFLVSTCVTTWAHPLREVCMSDLMCSQLRHVTSVPE